MLQRHRNEIKKRRRGRLRWDDCWKIGGNDLGLELARCSEGGIKMLLNIQESPYSDFIGADFCSDLLIYFIGINLYIPHLFLMMQRTRNPQLVSSKKAFPNIEKVLASILKYLQAHNIQKSSISSKDMLFNLSPKKSCLQHTFLYSLCKLHHSEGVIHASVISCLILPFLWHSTNTICCDSQQQFLKQLSPEQQMTKLLIDSPSTYNSFSREEEEFSLASSQEVYRPNRNPKKNRLWLKNKKKSIKTSFFNRSLWTLTQNTSYKQFLIGNSKLFDQDRQGRKILKINVMMSKLIKSRSADQCRSHHQKMIKYHRSIPQIIKHIEQLQGDILGSNGKEEEVDSMQRELGKTELIDFNDYEGQMRFRPEDGDLLEMFLTFSS